MSHLVEFLRSHAMALPTIAKFAIAMAITVCVPRLSRGGRLRREPVAVTFGATAFDTFDPAGQRLVDGRLLNVVLVLMLTTSILGPVLTERFAPRMLPDLRPAKAA